MSVMPVAVVTGGAGFIGANFVHTFLATCPGSVVNLDKLTYAGNLENLGPLAENSRHIFVKGDIGDRQLVSRLLETHRPQAIVNFAAESHVDRSISAPDDFIQTNVVATFNLLQAVRGFWEGLPIEQQSSFRFLHVSTDEVYGSLNKDDPAFAETTPYSPNSPYSASKAASDHLVRAYHHTYGLEVSTSNCSNNYGPWHFPEKLIPLCLTNILRGRPLPIYGDGMNIRDWLYVEDHCRGIELVLEQGRCGETYNIGGNNEWANIDIVKLLCERMDARFAADPTLAERFPAAPQASGGCGMDLITYVTDRAGHDRRYAIDASKISQELGYSPQHSFESGIEVTLDWYLGNQPWWQPLLVD